MRSHGLAHLLMRIFAVTLIAVVCWFMFQEYQRCYDAGGVLIRGAVWFVCLGGN